MPPRESRRDPLALHESPKGPDPEEQRLLDEQRREDLRAIMTTPYGFRWFKRFFEENGLLSNPFCEDERRTLHRCGEKNVALKIFAECCQCLSREQLGALIFRDPPKK